MGIPVRPIRVLAVDANRGPTRRRASIACRVPVLARRPEPPRRAAGAVRGLCLFHWACLTSGAEYVSPLRQQLRRSRRVPASERRDGVKRAFL